MTRRVSNEKGESFTLFFTIQSPFSNFYPCSFKTESIDGEEHTYCCVEQYYMYSKAIAFEDVNVAQSVMLTRNPKEMKTLGKNIQKFHQETWTELGPQVMEWGLEAKYRQNQKLREFLFLSFGSKLVECSPGDRVWGIGLSMDHPDAVHPSNWRGANQLGCIMEKVRQKLWADKEFYQVYEEEAVCLLPVSFKFVIEQDRENALRKIALNADEVFAALPSTPSQSTPGFRNGMRPFNEKFVHFKRRLTDYECSTPLIKRRREEVGEERLTRSLNISRMPIRYEECSRRRYSGIKLSVEKDVNSEDSEVEARKARKRKDAKKLRKEERREDKRSEKESRKKVWTRERSEEEEERRKRKKKRKNGEDSRSSSSASNAIPLVSQSIFSSLDSIQTTAKMMEEEKKDRVTRDCDMWEAAEKQKTAKEHAIQEDSETKEKASSKLRLLSKNLIKETMEQEEENLAVDRVSHLMNLFNWRKRKRSLESQKNSEMESGKEEWSCLGEGEKAKAAPPQKTPDSIPKPESSAERRSRSSSFLKSPEPFTSAPKWDREFEIQSSQELLTPREKKATEKSSNSEDSLTKKETSRRSKRRTEKERKVERSSSNERVEKRRNRSRHTKSFPEKERETKRKSSSERLEKAKERSRKSKRVSEKEREAERSLSSEKLEKKSKKSRKSKKKKKTGKKEKKHRKRRRTRGSESPSSERKRRRRSRRSPSYARTDHSEADLKKQKLEEITLAYQEGEKKEISRETPREEEKPSKTRVLSEN